jgi:hypothetical protein
MLPCWMRNLILEEAMTLPEDERVALAEQLLSSVPPDHEWLAELERRARPAYWQRRL